MDSRLMTTLISATQHTEVNKTYTQLSKEVIMSAMAATEGVSDCQKEYAVLVPKQVQVRKHKKRRINKKWAKRYGYKTTCPLKFGECLIIGDQMWMNQETFDIVRKSIPKGCSIYYGQVKLPAGGNK